jgi:hypothetical protein
MTVVNGGASRTRARARTHTRNDQCLILPLNLLHEHR